MRSKQDEFDSHTEVGGSNVEEEKMVNITVHPQVLSDEVLPKFVVSTEKITPSVISLDRNESQVCLISVYNLRKGGA